MALVVVRNNPELSEAFSNPEAQRFLRQLFREFSDANSMKYFIKKGLRESLTSQIRELKRSFRSVEEGESKTVHKAYKTVTRCFDGVTFKVGDIVIDMENPDGRRLPIGYMYEDDRGLHVRLHVDGEDTFTWRDLGRIEHQLPEPEIGDDYDE